MPWQQLSTRIAYENPWIQVTQDDVLRPDGSTGIYGVLRLRHPAVFVVAITDTDDVLLVSTDRYTTGMSIEVPSGGSDGEEPLQAAQRELFEETGRTASTWRALGVTDSLNGVCVAPGHVFLATGLQTISDTGSDALNEGITAVQATPWEEVFSLAASGQIRDAETLAALLLAALATGRVNTHQSQDAP